MKIGKILKYQFTNSLSILIKNRKQIEGITLKSIKPVKKEKVPLTLLDDEYFKFNGKRFIQIIPHLSKYKQKTVANKSLSNGIDYEQYPLEKLIQIALEKIEKDEEQGWQKLEQQINKLMRNTSISDNIHLITICLNKVYPFEQATTEKVIHLIRKELPYMTLKEIFWTFYTLSTLQFKGFQPQIKNLISSIEGIVLQQSKIVNGAAVQWILLTSFLSHSPTANLLPTLRKSFRWLNNLQLHDLQLILSAINFRRGLFESSFYSKVLKGIGKKIIDENKELLSKNESSKGQEKDSIRMKHNIFMIDPLVKVFQMSGDQILSHHLPTSDQLSALVFLWKYDLVQEHELKSLYEGIQIKIVGKSFQFVDLLLNMCTLELGLNIFHQLEVIKSLTANLSFIPRGLEWVLWNYAFAAKKIINDDAFFRQVSELLVVSYEEMDPSNLINEEKTRLASLKDVQNFKKFIHSIKIWDLTPLIPLQPTFYIPHFVNLEKKIIFHCYQEDDLLESGMQTNECLLRERLLLDHFGFKTIGIQMKDFLGLEYNERILAIKGKMGNWGLKKLEQ